MGTVSIGPALAGFPAFAPPDLAALTPQEIQGIFAELDFQFTASSFSFVLPASLFDLPGASSYSFSFTGNFASAAAYLANGGDPAGLFSNPSLLVQFETADVANLTTGLKAEGDAADAPGPPLPFAAFFGVLLNPVNFSQDILTALTGNLAQFDTIDVSAFTRGVILTRPSGSPTVSTYGAIQAPGGGLEAAAYGVASFAGELAELTFSQVIGGDGANILGAGLGDVSIQGGNGNSLLIGGPGQDVLNGGAGRNTLVAGSGDNTLTDAGASGFLLAGSGSSRLLAQGAGDVLVSGAGSSVLAASAGETTFVVQTAPGSVTTIVGFDTAAGDKLVWTASLAHLTLGADAAGDLTVAFGDPKGSQEVVFQGVHSILQVLPGLALPQVDGGALAFQAGSTGETLLAAPAGGTVRAHGPGETLIGQGGSDVLIAGPGGDVLVAGSGRDTLVGGSGNDILLGGPGNDTLIAGTGDDVLDGGVGDATLVVGPGADVVTGGPGADVFVFRSISSSWSRITDFQPGVDKIDLSAILGRDHVTAANFSDYVRLVPLGPTEYTGFLEVSPDGDPAHAQVVAQLDGAAWSLASGHAVSTLGFADFILR